MAAGQKRNLPHWARGSGAGRGGMRGQWGHKDAGWWSGANRGVPTYTPAGGPQFGREFLSAPVHLHKRMREGGWERGAKFEDRVGRDRGVEDEELGADGAEIAEVSEDDDGLRDEEEQEDGLDKQRLKAMYEAAAREYPDNEYEAMKKAEEEEELMERRLPRAVLMLVSDGVSEADVCVPVRVLRMALIEVEIVAVGSSLDVEGSSGIGLKADATLRDLGHVHEFLGIVVAGGNASHAACVAHDGRIHAMLKTFDSRRRLVCALGAGVLALKEASVLRGRKVAAPPAVRHRLPVRAKVTYAVPKEAVCLRAARAFVSFRPWLRV